MARHDPDVRSLSPEARQRLIASLLQAQRRRQGGVSSGQRALWSLHQLYPQESAYHVALAFRALAPIDRAALAGTFRDLAARHETLRTTYEFTEGTLLPIVRDSDADVQIVAAERLGEDELARRVQAEAYRPFDLQRGPVFRARIFQRRDGRDVFFLAAHHIALDFWSADVLLDELGQQYDRRRRDDLSLPAPVRGRYIDFAAREARLLKGGGARRSLDYWRRQLAGVPRLELPADRPRGPRRTFAGATLGFELDAAALARIHDVARAERATPFAVLLAGFLIVLHHYSGQDDLAVGVPTANRSGAVFSRMVGYFVNPMVVRTDLSRSNTVRALIAAVRDTVKDGLAHRRLPFPDLVERLGIPREPGRTPLFDAMFVFQGPRTLQFDTRPAATPGVSPLGAPLADARTVAFTMGPLVAERFPIGRPSVQFDLELETIEADARLHGVLSFNAGLFDEATAASLLHRYQHALRVIGDNCGVALDDPVWVPASERQSLDGWNATARAYDQDTAIDVVIAAQAERTPDRVAVVCGGEHVTYAALDRHASRIAARLLTAGVTPDAPVAILMERAAALPSALVGILRAGGAYVPLEPEHPDARLRQMLEEIGATLIVTSASTAARLPAGIQMVAAECDAPTPLLHRSPTPYRDQLAYVIYTSGSTGRPKGAMNTQASVLNRLHWMQEALALGADDRVLHKTPYGFDVSVWELFWPFLVGATMVVAKPGGHRDPAYLHELIQTEAVTTAHFVPSMLRAFLDEPVTDSCRSLRQLVCSGEALGWELQDEFLRRAPWCQLFNLYGPTEAAVDVTWHNCRGADETRPVPIGRPIANARLLVLDRHLAVVPHGAVGELYIAGTPVGRGYLGRPDLTAERFVPALDGAPGSRMYRTGDRARWRTDGALEVLGRSDDQVKVNGYRIEPMEIAHALRRHAALRDALVVATERDGRARLVAYYVARDVPVSADELRAFLAASLPAPMVPSAFVPLDRVPTTVNGKLDRRALPAPEWAPTTPPTTARSAIEQLLVEIWSSALNAAHPVGIHDNFFALGGDSILSITIAARARRLGLQVHAADVFAHATIAELAQIAERADPEVHAAVSSSASAPLTPIQRWFFEQDLARPDCWSHVLWCELHVPIDDSRLLAAIAAVHAAHDSLRLSFRRHASDWVQEAGHDAPAATILDMTALSEGQQAAARAQLVNQLGDSLSIASGPMFRALAVRGREPALVLAAHHLIVDSVSWLVLLDELESVVAGDGAGDVASSPLPAEPVAFREYARRLGGDASSSSVVDELAWWRNVGRESRSLRRFARASSSHERATTESRLEPAKWLRLLDGARSVHRAQLHEVLLAALLHALREADCGTHLLVDLEAHGRQAAAALDVSRTTGWFTSLFPVAFDLSHGRSATAALKEVKTRIRAVPGDGRGYGLLRYLGEPETRAALTSSPSADVCFNYLGRWEKQVRPGAALSLKPAWSRFSRGEGNRSPYLLEVTAAVMGSDLTIAWTHASHSQPLVDEIAELTMGAIGSLAGAADTAVASSDFPLARLSDAEFAALHRTLAGSAS